MTRRAALVVALVVGLTPGAAHADGATDRALAQSLFDDARELVKRGNYKEACPKLAESQRLDPGGGTLLNLALCHEQEGKTATAYAEFNEALSIAIRDGRKERERLARARIAALKPTLSSILVTVNPASEVNGFEVQLDGVTLRKAVWSSSTPVDPGPHRVEASAPGKRTWSTVVESRRPGEEMKIAIKPLEDLPPSTGATPVGEASASGGGAGPARAGGNAASRASAEGPEGQSSGSGQRTAGLVVGGVGLAGIGVGVVFGLQAISKRSASDKECHPEGCTPEGLARNDEAKSAAWISNIGFATGIVGLGLGTVLVLTAGSSKRPQAAALRVAPAWHGGPGLAAAGLF